MSRSRTLYCQLNSLRASSPERGASREFEFHLQFPYGSPSTELSDFRQSARSGNEHECKQAKTRAKGNDVITNVLSANQHFASAFSMQIFKFQRRCCKLSFLFPPRRQSAPESFAFVPAGLKNNFAVALRRSCRARSECLGTFFY